MVARVLRYGASDVVLDGARRVRMYSGWSYVLVQAGPHEARTWRSDERRWFTALPELMFPADRSWLVSSLWDDAWAGVGGSAELTPALLIEPELRSGAERTDPSIPDGVVVSTDPPAGSKVDPKSSVTVYTQDSTSTTPCP